MILIRADANETIGIGHLMRCQSIAYSFVKTGCEVLFIVADEKSDCVVDHDTFNSLCLNSDFQNLDEEISLVQQIIQESKPSLMLIDSYYVTNRYFDELSGMVRTAYLDDINKGIWNTDILINYNIFSKKYDYSGYDGRRLLLGVTYAPLRKEFSDLPNHIVKDKVTDIFVSVGGADPEKITEKIISEVCCRYVDISFHVVVGAMNSRIDQIRFMAGKNVYLHVNERNIAKMMMNCDIALSAAGSTLYELCASGVPTIAYSLADNQEPAVEEFERQKLMINAGDCRKDERFISDLIKSMGYIIKEKALREQMSYRMQRTVDGRGADRLAKELQMIAFS